MQKYLMSYIPALYVVLFVVYNCIEAIGWYAYPTLADWPCAAVVFHVANYMVSAMLSTFIVSWYNTGRVQQVWDYISDSIDNETGI